jgi:hypothetical protein
MRFRGGASALVGYLPGAEYWDGGRPPLDAAGAAALTRPNSNSWATHDATVARETPSSGRQLGSRPRPGVAQQLEQAISAAVSEQRAREQCVVVVARRAPPAGSTMDLGS